MKLALFDLDNTLLSGDSDFEWAQFLISRGVLDREVHEAENLKFYEQYKDGTLDIHAFLDFQLAPLARHTRTELDAWHVQFMAERILPMICDKARQLVQHHADEGALIAIVTATNSFITAPICREFGIPHLIATIPAELGGQFTGKVEGIPSFKEGKIVRVESWLKSLGHDWHSFSSSYFYSDSHNDLPLLHKVSHPVAVDPDDTLRATALAAGWPVISLRS
ncbi:Phosphoserine phosphatase [Georgfuchsia toluolica]|uniref:Phosphoserine phosphatase n=1 Tax=Georgfuchsia toluolica TaxID=424218 RepID=A0A916J2L4_9PROT|nr:HAD-IB family hydrolase [Georgfuchsia toluolica]CAG4883549.1 Phosphoserine phosphatase [Georgfuchsia toluolica]